MIDHPSEPTSLEPNDFSDLSEDDRRRELELELIRIRSEAEAARLDARAAELELTIRRLARGAVSTASRIDPSPVEPATPQPARDRTLDLNSAAIGLDQHAAEATTAEASDSLRPRPDAPLFSDWDAVRSVIPEQHPPQPSLAADPSIADQVITRRDQPHQKVDKPNFWEPTDVSKPDRDDPLESVASPDLIVEPVDASSSSDRKSNQRSQPLEFVAADEPGVHVDPGAVAIAADEQEADCRKRRSPAALLVSTVVHVLILIALAALTLSVHDPKDQVALAASVSESSEPAMETFQIETSQPESQPTESNPTESESEVSPLGELAVSDFAPETPPAPPTPMTSALESQMSAASMSLASDSEAKIQFCGVEGGGNHFVYLVDSSASMGDGFESARTELLHSIDVLKPDQRFYVIFFDAEPDYMRVSDPGENDRRSVFATPENKRALKRWAMGISKNTGRAPYEPLKFAMNLQPDVIFLLSDGEFPQGIEDLLKETNRVENLFGDSGALSIVHTIGYYSREGESRMRRIAEQNGGQYRHVPKP